jgi:hypothetical protein
MRLSCDESLSDTPKKETNMGKINFGRVLLGGLAAGLILDIGEYVLNDVVLAKQMAVVLRKFGVPEPGTNFIVIAVVMTFILGIVLVWLYALIRSRLGPGPKTAVVAAVIMWFGVYLYTGIINGTLFQIPVNLILIGFVWGLVEYILAALAGAALYNEA